MQPSILPPLLGGCRKVRVTKAERHIQRHIDAALHKLEESQCLALRAKGLGRIFDGLRAPCFIPFQFRDYVASIVGEDPSRLSQFASRFPLQCPSLQLVEALRCAFQCWEGHPTLCALMSVLIAGTCLKKGSSWPIGHVLLLPGQGTNQVCYIGDEAPKLLLLVNAARPQAPQAYVVEATACQHTIQLGHLFIACRHTWPYSQLQSDAEYNVELRDGQGVLNIGGYHCQQEGCLTCFLASCLQLAVCPWHLLPPSTSDESAHLNVAHFFCTKNLCTSTIDLVGQLADGPFDSVIQLFHVCSVEQIRQLGLHIQVAPNNVSLFHSSLSEAITTEEHLNELAMPFKHVELPHEIYRHLLIRAGGPASAFDVWLRERSREQ